MGKSRDPNKDNAVEHVSRPLSTLKDPSSFGPPPKHINYHGGAALPNQITPQTGGWGAPLTQDQIRSTTQSVNRPEEEEAEEETRRPGPPLPYRADRTGLKTDHLPPPPVHRDVNRNADVAEPSQAPKSKPGLPPRLPSRQNTATAMAPNPTPTPPPAAVASPPPSVAPPAYDSVPIKQPSPQPSSNFGTAQAATDRLGNAGVSVPALGIGATSASNPWQNEQSLAGQPRSPPIQSQPALNQVSELQARFARMNSKSNNNNQQSVTPPYVTPAQSPPPVATPIQQPATVPYQHQAIQQPPEPIQQQPMQATATPYQQQPQQAPAQGTTWAEKQAALRTAQNVQKDPSAVTVADATSAARTANSFRERHQDSINAAGQKANEWNRKYNVTGRLNSFLEKHSTPSPPPEPTTPGANTNGGPVQMPVQTQPQSPEMAASISRKPPPPPPPKKPANMHGGPPPVPLGTKPSYS